MPKTPEATDNTLNRYSPYYKSINKKLLTPCRQMGLSRKKITPNNTSSKKSKSNSKDSLESTPIRSSEYSSDFSSHNSNDLTPIERVIAKTTPVVQCKTFKTVVAKCKKETENTPPSKLVPIIGTDGSDTLPISSVKLKSSELVKSTGFKGFTVEENKIKKPVSMCLALDDKNKTEPVECSPQIIETHKPKKKSVRRSLSMKKSSEKDSFDETDKTETIKIIKDCTVQLNKIAFNQQQTQLLEPAIPPQDLDEDRFISELNIKDDVIKLERIVKEKQEQLSKLKQASIYQKRHNVQELQELTTTWKLGCKSALSDLLTQLQKHASIDMATLLDNLRIPEHMIKLSSSGDLV